MKRDDKIKRWHQVTVKNVAEMPPADCEESRRDGTR